MEGGVEMRNVLEYLYAVDYIKLPGFIVQGGGVRWPPKPNGCMPNGTVAQ